MAQFTYEYVKPIKEHFLHNSVTPNNFSKWSKENMYRLQNNFYFFLKLIFFFKEHPMVSIEQQFFINLFLMEINQKPQEPKNMHIPGYGGFIPSIVAENDFGKSYSQLTRNTLSRNSLGANPLKLSTTGLNFTRHDFMDPSLTAMSHKYGKQTISLNHPCEHAQEKITEFQASFKNPSRLIPPTFRETNRFLQNNKDLTKISGFLANYKQLDGKGWIPDQVLNAKRNITEYRARYNSEKPIHRNATIFHLRQLKKKNVPY